MAEATNDDVIEEEQEDKDSGEVVEGENRNTSQIPTESGSRVDGHRKPGRRSRLQIIHSRPSWNHRYQYHKTTYDGLIDDGLLDKSQRVRRLRALSENDARSSQTDAAGHKSSQSEAHAGSDLRLDLGQVHEDASVYGADTSRSSVVLPEIRLKGAYKKPFALVCLIGQFL